jgi:hypothetical protein
MPNKAAGLLAHLYLVCGIPFRGLESRCGAVPVFWVAVTQHGPAICLQIFRRHPKLGFASIESR